MTVAKSQTTTATTIYTISTECGIKRDFAAASIDEAKEIYSQEYHYDFDAVSEFPGSWFRVWEAGVMVEAEGECE